MKRFISDLGPYPDGLSLIREGRCRRVKGGILSPAFALLPDLEHGGRCNILFAPKAKLRCLSDLWKGYFLRMVRVFELVLLCLPSCATLKEADKADDLLDLAMILTHTAKPDAFPIEKASTGVGEIVTAHAVFDAGHVSVRGSVKKKFGSGWVSGAYSHVNVLVLDSRRRVTESRVVRFSPVDIPNNMRGQEGRSYFSVSLRAVPAPGSLIRVVFRTIP